MGRDASEIREGALGVPNERRNPKHTRWDGASSLAGRELERVAVFA